MAAIDKLKDNLPQKEDGTGTRLDPSSGDTSRGESPSHPKKPSPVMPRKDEKQQQQQQLPQKTPMKSQRMRLGALKKKPEKTKIPFSAQEIAEELKKDLPEEFINWKDLEFAQELGSGTSGNVFRGFYKSQEVAIKVLERERESRFEEFKHELKILSSVRGPYIVKFFGACVEPTPCLVMEYCARKSLCHILKDEKIEFRWDDFINFSTAIVKGIQTLHNHNPPIFHRDLKSLNILVTKDWVPRVCDFGLSRFRTAQNMSTFNRIRGTMAYCAPESFKGVPYSAKGDIYSLGILFWEMLYRVVTR
jgi:hypothetical protein